MSARGIRITAALSVAAAVSLVLGGCGKPQPTPTSTTAAAEIPLRADYSGTGPGTLRSAVKLATVDRRLVKSSATAARVTFESTSGIDGSPQLVSGAVFQPGGSPPPGGWPVIAMGHGTTGVQHECAPSLSEDLLGETVAIQLLLNAGYVVTLPDYQGLGLDQTYHPYLDSTTEGYNMIDSVRAARKLIPDASDRWLAYGTSQGGQAAWAANELAGPYGGGLHMVGAVSIAPAADITGLADLAALGKLTLEQASGLQWILVALHNEHPDLNLDDYRSGIVKDNWDVFAACQGPLAQQRQQLAKQITPDDMRPATPAAVDRLRDYLRQMGLPKGPTQAPMLVLHGDNDQVVAPPWTDAAVSRACGMGDVLESYVVPGRGHDDIDGAATLEWMKLRFDGADALNTCTAPAGPTLRLNVKPWYLE